MLADLSMSENACHLSSKPLNSKLPTSFSFLKSTLSMREDGLPTSLQKGLQKDIWQASQEDPAAGSPIERDTASYVFSLWLHCV